jgi:hypothetical protein
MKKNSCFQFVPLSESRLLPSTVECARQAFVAEGHLTFVRRREEVLLIREVSDLQFQASVHLVKDVVSLPSLDAPGLALISDSEFGSGRITMHVLPCGQRCWTATRDKLSLLMTSYFGWLSSEQAEAMKALFSSGLTAVPA